LHAFLFGCSFGRTCFDRVLDAAGAERCAVIASDAPGRYGSDGPERPSRPMMETSPEWNEEDLTPASRHTSSLGLKPKAPTRDRATLTMISGPETGKVFSLLASTTLGRSIECEVRIDDQSISRKHARITRGIGSYLVEDLASRNGTFVDGDRVQRHELHDGERLQLGSTIQLRFAMTADDEEHLQRKLYESSVRDPLTGVFNRKHLNERLTAEVAYAVRHKTDLALLMFDLDHFKGINDEYGHQAGDRVLVGVAGLVLRTIRLEDVLCRYGGEEFVVLVRGTDVRGAMALAERIRAIVETARIVHEEQPIAVKVSIGVATISCCQGQITGERLIGVADQRLYNAKQQGRNRVVGP
jgi:two-component system, cell cycle response regulator